MKRPLVAAPAQIAQATIKRKKRPERTAASTLRKGLKMHLNASPVYQNLPECIATDAAPGFVDGSLGRPA